MVQFCRNCIYYKANGQDETGYCEVFDDWLHDIDTCSMYEEKAA